MNERIGTATASGDRQDLCELRVFDSNGGLALTFLNSSIARYGIEDPASGLRHAEGELKIAQAFSLPILRRGALIEIWFTTVDRDRMLFRGRLDYIETTCDDGVITHLTFEARSPAAELMDASFKGPVGPSVASTVSQIVQASGLEPMVDFPDTPISAWVDVQSSYGALRLLAISLGAVVRTRDEKVEFLSDAAFIERMNARPVVRLSRDQIQSSRTKQGQPIKKR